MRAPAALASVGTIVLFWADERRTRRCQLEPDGAEECLDDFERMATGALATRAERD
jgi:hypothetical protein